MSQTVELTSIGRFASELQRTTSFIRSIANRLEIEPAAMIDGVPYFVEPDLIRITDEIRKTEALQNAKS